MEAEGRRQTRGRQKIPMQLIENQDDLYATFSKRRLGIYKKATELCTLCDVDIGIILFSPTDVPYSFFHPRMESVVSRSMNPDEIQQEFDIVVDSHTQTRIQGMNVELDRIIASREAERVRWQRAMEEVKTRSIWMRQKLDTITREQALVWRAWFREYKVRVTRRIEQIKNQASGSAMPPLPPPLAGDNVLEDMVIGEELAEMAPPPPPGQFYYPGQTSKEPNFDGGGAPSAQYYYPTEGQNVFAAGGSGGGVGPSQELNLGPPGYDPYYVLPAPPPDFSAAGGDDVDPGQFYVPFQPRAGGADEAGQFYFPPPPYGGGSYQDEAGPSHQKDD
ncbi:uncharacterized protein [Henckelia pumila]|uniref:uncharacterized protein n=1 Tax=Henckelia pumila TaxID=405737 RepID=UPI003C6E7473